MTRGRRIALGFGVALLVLVADQVSKWWVLGALQQPGRSTIEILPVLDLVLVRNAGITFGLFRADSTAGSAVLTVAALAVITGIVIWMLRVERWLMTVALGAIAGGAVGNVIDRVRYGSVVDFIHAHAFGYEWYVFNVADAAIVCGVATLLLDGLRGKRGWPTCRRSAGSLTRRRQRDR